MMSKKGAISLAINTIVIVMISLVVLGLGISLMRNMISGAEEIKDQLDMQTEEELERLLVDQGKKVALPLHTVTLEAGENHVFGIGILNIDTDTYGEEFTINIELSKVLDDTDDEITSEVDIAGALLWVLYDTSTLTIEENGYRKESILVDVPEDAKKGTYIYNVEVDYITPPEGESDQYDNVKKFYVTVE
ncbi:hypothetical protein HN385_05215 [archaeon]|nr:hypothetical protein [archaeon]MBT3451420.1 hypothetical protein [archaeon]MBT6869235.1 hypothetical protein [archaeon]MBT7193633.1 hypothetical protein [archaeon]MBT7380251.1 hypothetical protein [archaeon]